MLRNHYNLPFSFRHGQHLMLAMRLGLAAHISQDDPLPPVPEDDPLPPVPEPEPPVPVPEPEPLPPVPDDPVPPPPDEDWQVDRHFYPGFLVLVDGDPKDVLSQGGRGYWRVDGATLDTWGLSTTSDAKWQEHLDATLAAYATWRRASVAFTVPRDHALFGRLQAYVLQRGGLVVAL